MQALVHLRNATVPKIFLTATLVPSHQQVLADSVGISLSQTLILRSPTARPNHRFQIVSVPPPSTPFSVGLRLASFLLEAWGSDLAVRGILFVRSLKKLHNLANSAPFDVCTYHGQMAEQEKRAQLDSWLSDEQPAKWMISTTALLHGVDYPRVDAVVFLECPFGVYDFVQGAGRAGRSGQEALIVVLHDGPPDALPEENKYACRKEMEDILLAPACRRLGVSRVMDGDGVSCNQSPNSLLCDFCDAGISPFITDAINPPAWTLPPKNLRSQTPLPQNPPQTTIKNTSASQLAPRPPPKPSPTAMITGFTAQANTAAREQHARSVKELMERHAGCFACRIQSETHSPCHNECGDSGASGCCVEEHIPYECTRFTYKRGWMDWKKRHFSWPGDVKRCHFCGFPGTIAVYGHRRAECKCPGICRYSDSAVVAAWHVLHTPQLFEKLQNELDFVPGADVKASFATWLTQYGSDSEDLRLLSVFAWLCSQFYPPRL
jgi:hypothetical protein